MFETVQRAFSLSEECAWLVTDRAEVVGTFRLSVHNVLMDSLIRTEFVLEHVLKEHSLTLHQDHVVLVLLLARHAAQREIVLLVQMKRSYQLVVSA